MSQEGTPSLENDPWALRKPDWADWGSKKSARLWQAVALACDLDPNNFTTLGLPRMDRFFKHPPQEIEDLLMLAKSSIGAGILKPIALSKEALEESEVNLSSFTTWLNSIGHQFPTEFPWQPEVSTFSNINWPWGRHETDLLRKLAEVADKFWKNYDPSDPTTAPTNQQVSDWLKAQGVADRTAQIMATILRADGLPTGPRK